MRRPHETRTHLPRPGSAAGGCRPIDLPSSALDPWPTSCNPDEYDCDRDASDGCESDLRTTADCGGCGLSCAAEPNATATCETGVCARKACKEGFFDCDGEPDNGCESKHRELDNCGACHMPCALPNASASCATGTCEVAACDDGWLDVNGEPSDGCEVDTRTSVLHCGSRDHACPPNPDGGRAACDGGVCIVECDPGRADCDDDPTTGCEAHLDAPKTCGGCDHACTGSTPVCSGSEADGFDCISGTCSPPRPDRCGDSCVNTKTSVNHCGECGTVCADAPHASPACLDGNCTVQCDPSYARCDVDPTNGCETKLGTVTHCQGCTDSCLDDHVASGTCGPAGCEIGTCQTGFDDCDDRADDGCETPLDTATDCGACGVACAPTNATGVCGAGGACKIGACSSGWVDFDGKPGNGCERACPSGCGSCAPTCAPGTSCACGTGGCPCVLRCGAACQASCTTDCTVDAAGQADSAITCRSGASCDIDCSGSSRCEVVCKAGSICTVDVKGSTGYDITCEAAVLLGPAAAQCEIKREDAAGRLSCPGVLGSAVKSCAPNRVVCNRGC